MASLVTVGRQAKQGARQTFHNNLACTQRSYELARGRQVGNFPQLFTHLAQINAVRVLGGERIGTRSTPPALLPRLPAPPRRPALVKLTRP